MNSLNHYFLGDSRAQAGQQIGISEPIAQQWPTHAHVLTPISKKPDGTARQQCQLFHGRAPHWQGAVCLIEMVSSLAKALPLLLGTVILAESKL